MNKQGPQSALHATERLCSWPRESEGARENSRWGGPRQQFMVVQEYSPTPEKWGRGRPMGSGKWQTSSAYLGGINVADTAGSDITPYTITVQPGKMPPNSICILSASGRIYLQCRDLYTYFSW
ncbi:hypothetical protein Salat_0400100 [Sesamum alatum]|uniref:Uncharacterized protein n=1 Tax=Sesamum alatum TaxID=300844 RepID=A0AAE1Z2A0_9LAMI|nr:hypothetical protein Salat_0400100 [Sesamum alatum]